MAKNPHGLQERFMDNPFSIINTATGRWQDRKRMWIAQGLKSEVGRSARAFNIQEWMTDTDDVQVATQSDTSIFDPALCELLYTWFAKKGGTVLDPFAGGSVRGIVASKLGMIYWGHELREEQVEANWEQAKVLCSGDEHIDCKPHWTVGDSLKTLDMWTSPQFDFLLTCPPYGDLEVYSKNPADISNMSVGDFDEAYAAIMAKALSKMNPNTFACVVVGDYRDKDGYLTNFVSKTIDACQVHGFRLYNEIILQNVVGTLALRVAKQFERNRKIGKMHQNVLVFYNGTREDLAKLELIDQVTAKQQSLAEWI